MASFSLDPLQIFGFADVVRSWLPWPWRPLVSPWLVLCGMSAVAALIFLALHFGLREKPKIDWRFEKTGYPVRLGWSQPADGPRTYNVESVDFSGENISGHTLHQFDGEIILVRDRRRLPLLVVADSAWIPISELDSVPPKAIFFSGGQFRSDGVHWTEFSKALTPDEFLRDFGGFEVSITIDGDKKTWSFTLDELREQFEAQKRDAEEQWLKNPMNRPQVKRKKQA
jgi:hypothetical protein